MKTKTYRIEFQDNNQNELWVTIVEAIGLKDATDYANQIFAETNHNDLFTFTITEI